ncbi:N-acetylmuramoyl-L-alanine amidase [Peribacillus sp. NPDC097675]|uniref:N-acetylmuramoyl-L-alanine amidase n=1 Tax=Peribacillus sp. NPDC097675 TaxID=3390618 RepID=UPI003D084C07
MVKIYIDPGHGGTDSGTVGNGLREKDLTLQIGTRIKDILAGYKNVTTKMSRSGDTYPSLSTRTNEANAWGADFFLSVHINAGGGTGYEDYIYTSTSKETKTYQDNIHGEIMKLINMKDRGQKTGDLHVLRESSMPALLTENGFIDNTSDAAQLKKSSFIEAIAQGHVNGLVKSFNLKMKDEEVSGSTHIVVKGDTLYSIAKKYGTTVAKLQTLNPKVEADSLQIGLKLIISGSTSTFHKVVKGDTVSALAKKYGSTIQQIKNWNDLDSKYTITIGRKIRVK